MLPVIARLREHIRIPQGHSGKNLNIESIEFGGGGEYIKLTKSEAIK
jgi:hypothetical protein